MIPTLTVKYLTPKALSFSNTTHKVLCAMEFSQDDDYENVLKKFEIEDIKIAFSNLESKPEKDEKDLKILKKLEQFIEMTENKPVDYEAKTRENSPSRLHNKSSKGVLKFRKYLKQVIDDGYVFLDHGKGSHTFQLYHPDNPNVYLNFQRGTHGDIKRYHVKNYEKQKLLLDKGDARLDNLYIKENLTVLAAHPKEELTHCDSDNKQEEKSFIKIPNVPFASIDLEPVIEGNGETIKENEPTLIENQLINTKENYKKKILSLIERLKPSLRQEFIASETLYLIESLYVLELGAHDEYAIFESFIQKFPSSFSLIFQYLKLCEVEYPDNQIYSIKLLLLGVTQRTLDAICDINNIYLSCIHKPVTVEQLVANLPDEAKYDESITPLLKNVSESSNKDWIPTLLEEAQRLNIDINSLSDLKEYVDTQLFSLAIKDNDTEARFYLGFMHKNEGFSKKQIESGLKASGLETGSCYKIAALIKLGGLYRSDELFQLSNEILDKALELSNRFKLTENGMRGIFFQGTIELELGKTNLEWSRREISKKLERLNLALGYFTDSLKKCSTDILKFNIIVNIGTAYLELYKTTKKQGDLDSVYNILEDAIKKCSYKSVKLEILLNFAEVCLALYETTSRKKYLDSAIQQFNSAISEVDIYSKNGKVHMLLFYLYQKKVGIKPDRQAIELFEKSIQSYLKACEYGNKLSAENHSLIIKQCGHWLETNKKNKECKQRLLEYKALLEKYSIQ